MKTMYDVQQLLKRFGTFIYTGNRLGDLQLMDIEINELYEANLINVDEYKLSKVILKREISHMLRKNV